MIRYTTPTHTHRVVGIDLTSCDVWVSYEQGLAQVDLKGSVELDGSDSLVTVSLTQKQTARFKEGALLAQINWVYPNGKRDATDKKEMPVKGNLMAREVPYGME